MLTSISKNMGTKSRTVIQKPSRTSVLAVPKRLGATWITAPLAVQSTSFTTPVTIAPAPNVRELTQKHAKKWLDKHSDKLLPVHYFHVVFTLPKEIGELARSAPSVYFNILFKSVRICLHQLMTKSKYGGGIPAALCVLHTWTRTLLFHPHIHCLVPGVVTYKTRKGKWKFNFTSRKFLAPVKVLSRLFRAVFIRLVRKKFPQLKIPQSVFAKDWVVYSKPTHKNTKSILQYLSQYIYRCAITNKRIVSVKDSKVTFKYQDSKNHQWHTMTLGVMEFIRRYLQHVLPRGFHKVRFLGFFSPSYKKIYSSLKLELSKLNPDQVSESTPNSHDQGQHPYRICPNCQCATLKTDFYFYYRNGTPFLYRPPPHEKNKRLS